MRPFGVAVIAPLRPLDVIRLHVQFCIDGARPKWWRSPALSNAQLPLVEALTAAFGLHPHVTAVSADRSVVHAARTQTAPVGPRELLSDVADRPLPNALRISRIPPHANVAALLAPCVPTGRVPAQMWAQSRSRCGPHTLRHTLCRYAHEVDLVWTGTAEALAVFRTFDALCNAEERYAAAHTAGSFRSASGDVEGLLECEAVYTTLGRSAAPGSSEEARGGGWQMAVVKKGARK